MYGHNEVKMVTSLRSSINRSINGSATIDASRTIDNSRQSNSLSAQKNDYLGKSYGKNVEARTEYYQSLTLKDVIKDFTQGYRERDPESPVKKLTYNTQIQGLTRKHNLAMDNHIGHGRTLTHSIDFRDTKQTHDNLNPGIGHDINNKALE